MADITWQTTKLPDALIGVAYEAGLGVTFTGSAINPALTAASVSSGSLPAGLALSADKVRITGTPTGPASQATIKITLTDAGGAVQSSNLTINVRYPSEAELVELGSARSQADLKRQWPTQF